MHPDPLLSVTEMKHYAHLTMGVTACCLRACFLGLCVLTFGIGQQALDLLTPWAPANSAACPLPGVIPGERFSSGR